MPRASSLRAAVLVASRRLQAGSKFRLSRCAAAGATSRVCPPAGQYAAITGRCVLACAHLRLAVVIVDLLQVRHDRLRILHVGDVDLVDLLAGHRQSLKGVGQVVARLGQGLLGRLLRGEWAGAARSDRRARRDMQATARGRCCVSRARWVLRRDAHQGLAELADGLVVLGTLGNVAKRHAGAGRSGGTVVGRHGERGGRVGRLLALTFNQGRQAFPTLKRRTRSRRPLRRRAHTSCQLPQTETEDFPLNSRTRVTLNVCAQFNANTWEF